jgi:glyoxylase-like metal-dependent hydrolase (beta-lactamase superfamily II)
MESTTYLLIDKDGKETAIFSGDTLFIGDVGRPDLAQKSSFHDSRSIGCNIISFLKRQNHDLAR